MSKNDYKLLQDMLRVLPGKYQRKLNKFMEI